MDEPEAAAAPQAAAPQVDEVDLGLVQQSWPAIMEGVKDRKKSTHAFLAMGIPRELDQGSLVLEFPAAYGFHAENCGSEASQEIIGGVIEAVLGIRPRLRCVVGDGDGEDRPPPLAESDEPPVATGSDVDDAMESEAAEEAGELPDEAEAHDRALETLTRDLGARVLDDDDG